MNLSNWFDNLNYDSSDIKKVRRYIKKELGTQYDLDMLGVTLKQSGFPWALVFVYLFQAESYGDACQIIMDHFMEAFK